MKFSCSCPFLSVLRAATQVAWASAFPAENRQAGQVKSLVEEAQSGWDPGSKAASPGWLPEPGLLSGRDEDKLSQPRHMTLRGHHRSELRSQNPWEAIPGYSQLSF